MQITVFFVHLLLDITDINYTLTVVCSGYRDLLQRGKMVNETPQQSRTRVKIPKGAKRAVFHTVCDPSLKRALNVRREKSGFCSETDAIKTLARDFVAGRINYKGGVLVSQQENSQPDSAEGQGGPPAAPESSKANPAMVG